jgi:hypothetical protein
MAVIAVIELLVFPGKQTGQGEVDIETRQSPRDLVSSLSIRPSPRYAVTSTAAAHLRTAWKAIYPGEPRRSRLLVALQQGELEGQSRSWSRRTAAGLRCWGGAGQDGTGSGGGQLACRVPGMGVRGGGRRVGAGKDGQLLSTSSWDHKGSADTMIILMLAMYDNRIPSSDSFDASDPPWPVPSSSSPTPFEFVFEFGRLPCELRAQVIIYATQRKDWDPWRGSDPVLLVSSEFHRVGAPQHWKVSLLVPHKAAQGC